MNSNWRDMWDGGFGFFFEMGGIIPCFFLFFF